MVLRRGTHKTCLNQQEHTLSYKKRAWTKTHAKTNKNGLPIGLPIDFCTQGDVMMHMEEASRHSTKLQREVSPLHVGTLEYMHETCVQLYKRFFDKSLFILWIGVNFHIKTLVWDGFNMFF